MKDGFYLSTYLFIDELAHLMDIRVRHDQNIALWKKSGYKIQLIHFWELERITGLKKHSSTFYNVNSARKFINNLLQQYDLTLNDMVEIWGTTQLDTSKRYIPPDDGQNLSCHSIYHLFSSMLLDSKIFFEDKIIAFAVDAGPDAVIEEDASEKNFYAAAYIDKGKKRLINCLSPGRLWSYAKRKFGLQEGSLMALASASTTAFKYDYSEVLKLTDKNGYTMAKTYVDSITEKAESIIKENNLMLFTGLDPNFTTQDNLISMVAKEIQKSSYKIMDYNVELVRKKFNVRLEDTYLSMSGGFALNCPTNTHLLKKFKFKGFLAVPPVSDCGISLGIGLYSFYRGIGGRFEFKFERAYYGNLNKDFKEVIEVDLYKPHIKLVSEINPEQFIKDLTEYPIVWINDRSEIGPRALGNRSILGDPTNIKTKDYLNVIKKREWWRPVAPIVLEEHVGYYFDRNDTSPYMLQVYDVKQDMLDKLPAILHIDNTARIQTINSQTNPTLYKLIKYFGENKGVNVICNTSLNDAGEPIIDSISQALNFALRKNIKVVYANEMRIELHNHHEFRESNPEKRDLTEFQLFNSEERKKMLQNLNKFNLSPEEYTCYIENRHLFPEFNIDDKREVRKVKMVYQMITSEFGEVFDRG